MRHGRQGCDKGLSEAVAKILAEPAGQRLAGHALEVLLDDGKTPAEKQLEDLLDAEVQAVQAKGIGETGSGKNLAVDDDPVAVENDEIDVRQRDRFEHRPRSYPPFAALANERVNALIESVRSVSLIGVTAEDLVDIAVPLALELVEEVLGRGHAGGDDLLEGGQEHRLVPAAFVQVTAPGE